MESKWRKGPPGISHLLQSFKRDLNILTNSKVDMNSNASHQLSELYDPRSFYSNILLLCASNCLIYIYFYFS